MTHRRREPGGNEAERSAFHLAQQQLRSLARRGHTLEVDHDGVPMPSATGTSERGLQDPYTLGSSLPALKARTPKVLGEIARLWRRRCNLARSDIAEHAGVTPRFVSDLEAGKPGSSVCKVLLTLDAMGLELLVRPKRSHPTHPADRSAHPDPGVE